MQTSSFFTDQHLSEEGISLYVDALKLQRVGELPEELRVHVESCAECQLQIVEVHEMLKEEIYDTSAPHPYFDKQKVREPIYRYGVYRIAAAVAGAALLGIGYYSIVSRETPVQTVAPQTTTQNSTITQEPSRTEPQQPSKNNGSDLLAEHFTESPNLEDLVHGEFRSTSIQALFPVVGKVASQPIVFRWKDNDEPITLKIVTNKEVTVASTLVRGDSYMLKKNLPPGLYYWKLESKDELLYVGKFIVK